VVGNYEKAREAKKTTALPGRFYHRRIDFFRKLMPSLKWHGLFLFFLPGRLEISRLFSNHEERMMAWFCIAKNL